MAKVWLICGKICSGKTWYARKIRDSFSGVILSTDEVTWDLIDNEQGAFYDSFAKRVNLYLRKNPLLFPWWSRSLYPSLHPLPFL